MKKKKPPTRSLPRDVVLLRDLAPREEVQGGTDKRLFGERGDSGADAGKRGRAAPVEPSLGGRKGHRK
jgi:hypothetical protein